MFSDGIRPGGDLTELDGSTASKFTPRKPFRTSKKIERAGKTYTSRWII